MKKINYLGLVGLGCGALLLSGCGGKSHTLKCELKSDSQEQVVEIEFDKDEKKAKNLYYELTIKLDEGITDEQINEAKNSLKEGCESQGNKNCKVSSSKNKITYSFETEPDNSGFDASGSLEEVKKLAEEDGFSCK